MSGGRFSVDAVFRAVDKLTGPVKRMEASVGGFARNAEKRLGTLNARMSAFSDKFKGAATTAAAAGAVVGTGIYNVVAAGAEFEQAITNVGAVSLMTRDQIAPLEAMALNLGATTQFTATQVAAAMETMGKAGFDNSQILAGVPGILAAAAASGLGIEETANHVSNALKGFGMEVSRSTEVADVLALASVRTNSSIGSLGESLANVSSTARQLNVPIQDATAAVALLQDVGLDASVAGSALNTMLTQMAKPTAAIAAKMKKFGISFKDAKGNMLPFEKVIEQVTIAGDKAGGTFDKVAFFADLVGLRGQKAAGNLADLFKAGKLQELTAELYKAAGVSQQMADIRMDTTLGDWETLGGSIDGVKMKIFGMSNGPLREVIQRMTEWVDANAELIAGKLGEFLLAIVNNFDEILLRARQLAGAILIFKGLEAAIMVTRIALMGVSAATWAVSGAMTAYSAIVKAWPAISAAASAAMWVLNLAMNANPVGLLVLGFAALIALGGLIYLAWEPVGNFFSALYDKIAAVVSGARKFGEVFGMLEPESVTGVPEYLRGGEPAPQVIGPQDRAEAAYSESVTRNYGELTIKDETKRAKMTTPIPGISLLPSGGF